MVKGQFVVRPAVAADADGIAEAHVASIRTLGAKFYSPEIIERWGAPRTGQQYLEAMEREALFVAVPQQESADSRILGFSSYRFEEGRHRTAIYVRGDAARIGVGTALFSAAESAARRHGAAEIDVTASLGAVEFYKANGFEELGAGEHQLGTGRKMACVFMRKRL